MKQIEMSYIALLNGKVITIDPHDNIAEAILIAGEKIIAVGKNEEIKKLLPHNGISVDLGGRSVIPGFVDSHVHLELSLNRHINAVQCNTPPFDSLEQIFNAIKKKVAETPDGEWVIAVGSGVMEEKVREGRMPSREELDIIAPNNPLMFDAEIHTTLLNTRAIEKLGWKHETWIPKHATLGRDFTTGELTGIYTEVWPGISITPWSYEKLIQALRIGTVKHYVSRGWTSSHELSYSTDGIRAWQQLKHEGELPLRLRFYLTHPYLIDIDQFSELGLQKGFGDHWMSIGGVKIFIDGVHYHANMHPLLDVKWTQDELDAFVYKAHKANLHIWAHTVTPLGIEMGVKAYERLLKICPTNDHRLRLEHAGDHIPNDKMLYKMKLAGIIPITTPQFIHSYPKLPKPKLHSMIKKGMIFPGNSDITGAQPEAFDPWHSIWVAVTRKDYYGHTDDPDECISPLQALRMFTLWGAWGGFEEKIKGSIEPGKLADLVVLGKDPLTIEHDALREMPVELVIVGGETKYAGSAFSGALDQ